MNIHSDDAGTVEQATKREAVLDAALRLVAEHGFHGSPMALIAENAGVAAGTIYRFFDGKDALIKEVHACIEQRILAAVTEDYPHAGSVRERFLHIGRRIVRYFLASPLHFRFLEQFHYSPYGRDHRRDKLFRRKDSNVISELIAEARDGGIIKPLPQTVLSALMFGPLADVCRDHILGFTTLDDRLVEQTVAACWDAVRQPAAHQRRERRRGA